MNFNSLEFLIFYPVVILLYFILPKKARWVLLLIASYFFYMCWNPIYVTLIFSTTLVSYLCGLGMEKIKSQGGRRALLIVTLVVCLGLLVVFKYLDFIIGNSINLLNLFGMELDPITIGLVLPVGISFYTFQTLSYVIDTYWGKIESEHHFGYFALYVSFFPQLVAGPIERPENLLPQLKEGHDFNIENFQIGLEYMLMGFFRKCVVADFIGIYVNTVFADLANCNSLAIVFGGSLFLIEIYCDFAGYSEIAIGAAKIMGIDLMKNFNSPYMATSVRDLMRRWHISLNTWFRDYVYIPLGGNRKGAFRRILNVIIVYALCGLWHGASWTYVFWGLYVGIMVVIEGFLRKPYRNFCAKHHIDNNNAGIKMVRRILVFLLYIPAGWFFRCQSIQDLGTLFSRFFTTMGFSYDYFSATFSQMNMTYLGATITILLMVILLFIGLLNESQGKEKLGLSYYQGNREQALAITPARVSLYTLLRAGIILGWLYLASQDAVSSFAYFQF